MKPAVAFFGAFISCLFFACNNAEMGTAASAPSADTTRTAASGKQAAAPAAEAPAKTPTDSSRQNYVFSTAGDLQITGDEYNYKIELPTDVLFDFDNATLRPEGVTLLQKAKQHFQAHKSDQVHVWGHTDSKGSTQYNYVLSQKRTKAVADWLKRETGVFAISVGRGKEEPLAPNENEDGSDNPLNRQKNRRVTISVVKYPDADKMIEGASEKANNTKQ